MKTQPILPASRDHCLYEVGQVYVPTAMLVKPAGQRDAVETAACEAQYEAGYRLAHGAGVPEDACVWLYRLRERYDGHGPDGLAGDAIPIESRVIRAAAVCQAALVAPPDGTDLPPERRAIEALRAASGGELDPQVADALIAVLVAATRGG